jgi:hypothetical protein
MLELLKIYAYIRYESKKEDEKSDQLEEKMPQM